MATKATAFVYFSTSLRAHNKPPRALSSRDALLIVPLVRGLQKGGTRDFLTATSALWLNVGAHCNQVPWCTSPHGVIHEARGLDSGLTQGSTFCLLVQDTAASSRQPLENGCPHLFSNKTCSFTVIGEKLLN